MRDKETKKIRDSFTSETAAKNYLQSKPFGLGNYYEIYDSKINKVVFEPTGKKKKMHRSNSW